MALLAGSAGLETMDQLCIGAEGRHVAPASVAPRTPLPAKCLLPAEDGAPSPGSPLALSVLTAKVPGSQPRRRFEGTASPKGLSAVFSGTRRKSTSYGAQLERALVKRL